MAVDDHATGFDPGLGRVFNFDAADLDANRTGRLSEQQELILRNTVRVQVRHASRARVMVAIASGEHYWAHIGQVRFGIDTEQWDELDDDARYRFPIDGDAAPLSLERV